MTFRIQCTIVFTLLLIGGIDDCYAANSMVTPNGAFEAVALSPSPNVNDARIDSQIEITFNQPVSLASVTPQSFWVFGRWSGAVEGKFSYSNSNQTVALTPDRPFSAGEQVMVVLSNNLQSADGSPFRSAGLSFQFFVRAEPQSALDFVEIAEMTTRTDPDISTRSYGGIATDLNEDGWMDITVVNEDTADLRTFLNRGDSTGSFNNFLMPPASVGDRASPSEPTDFNRDGHADVCVVNINSNTVSVLLGNGDGTFAPQQQIFVGNAPRGIAVLDVDGDGDTDIVNTNSGSSNLSLLINNGNGVFGNPTFFEGGGAGEWSLAAADMDNDNILDLVVGARNSETIIVNKCNGDGTFTAYTPQSAGGSTWMIVCGDLDGDGNQDITSANSSDNNGSVLLGNGNGGLSAPTTSPTDAFPLATDLADLDGDGDLDWVVASFGGDWFVFKNNGNGSFAMDQEIDAPIAASCSLAADIDNDQDLDLVLIDELLDVIIVMRNAGFTATANAITPVRGTLNGGEVSDTATSDDQYLNFLADGPSPTTEPAIQFVLDGTLSTDKQDSLELAFESNANTVGLTNTIEVFNWNIDKYELVDSFVPSVGTDSGRTVDLTAGIADYVQPRTNAVRCRIGFQQSGPVLFFPWQIRVDKFSWTEL